MRDRNRSWIEPGFIRALMMMAVLPWLFSPPCLLAQAFDKAKYFRMRLAKAGQEKPKIAGNGIYKIVLEDFVGAGVGLYSVRTGPNHPVTLAARNNKPQDLLAGASLGLNGTSFTTIRSYTSQTDYVQSSFITDKNAYFLDNTFTDGDSVVPRRQFFKPIITEGDTTGFRVVYKLPQWPGLKPRSSDARALDSLEITQIINVRGREFADSWVELTTIVTNIKRKDEPITLGVRYLWDLKVAEDDGPVLRQRAGDALGPNEMQTSPIDFAFYQAEANDNIANIAPPAYHFFGSALTPTNLRRAPQQPQSLHQVFWPRAFFTAFDYSSEPNLRVVGGPEDSNATITGGDNAVLYFWGETAKNATTLWPRQSLEVTQALFGSLPEVEPPNLFDWEAPVCDAITIAPPQTLTVVMHDAISGMQAIRILEQQNVRVDLPDFAYGVTSPVEVRAEVLDPAQPMTLLLLLRDVAGNTSMCDPIMMTLRANSNSAGYHIAPTWADRYFYIKNHGLERIEVSLNEQHFILQTAEVVGRNVFPLPAQGELTIDLIKHLQPSNQMTITGFGPPGSHAEVVLADMNLKANVDLVLALTPAPRHFTLAQNRPNPFRGHTVIRFELPETGQPSAHVTLRIYNMLGQLVRTLVNKELPTRAHTMNWDGRDAFGREVAGGVYLYRLTAGENQAIKKMVLLR